MIFRSLFQALLTGGYLQNIFYKSRENKSLNNAIHHAQMDSCFFLKKACKVQINYRNLQNPRNASSSF